MEFKKSKAVPAILVISVAALVLATGCSSEPRMVRRCLDANGQILPEEVCNGSGYYGSSYYYGGRSYMFYGSPHWGYGGGGSYAIGGFASGYSRTAPSSSVSRGGFGGTSAGSGGFYSGMG